MGDDKVEPETSDVPTDALATVREGKGGRGSPAPRASAEGQARDVAGMDRATADATPNQPRSPTHDPLFATFAGDGRARFERRGELGRGGMGRVIEMYDRALGRSVAFKIALGQSPAELNRFEREARITAQLAHPAIVPIHDVGVGQSGEPFYVMRKLEGTPLSKQVRQDLTLAARLALMVRVLPAIDACGYAHARAVIHRDIKPPNIVLGDHGETMLIDWGLARADDDEPDPTSSLTRPAAQTEPVHLADTDQQGLTRMGHAYGTPGFLAPEQARGERVDARADVFALGATLYYVLSGGQVLFDGGDGDDMLERAASGAAPDLSGLPATLPEALRTIIRTATAADRRARYPTAVELAADLRRFLDGHLVSAHTYTRRERLRRWIHRHRPAVATAAVAMVAMVALATVAVNRVIDARDRAEHARARAEAAGRTVTARRDALVFERAQRALDQSGVEALAWLGELDDASPLWSSAGWVATAAGEVGLPRKIADLVGQANVLGVAPNGRWALVRDRSDRVYRLDLEKPALTVLASQIEHSGAPVAWRDSTHAVIWLGSDSLLAVDVEAGTTELRQLDGAPTTGVSATEDPDRSVLHGADGVAAYRWSTRERTVIAAHGRSAEVAVGATVVGIVEQGEARLYPLGATAPPVVIPDVIAIDIDARDHIAIAHATGGIATYQRDGTLKQRWLTQVPAIMVHVEGDGVGALIVNAGRSQHIRCQDGVAQPLLLPEAGVMGAQTFLAGHRQLITNGAEAWLVTPSKATRLSALPAMIQSVDSDPEGRRIVFALADGSIHVLDVRQTPVVPTPVPMNVRLVELTEQTLWIRDDFALMELDRATGRTRRSIAIEFPEFVEVDVEAHLAWTYSLRRREVEVIDLARDRRAKESQVAAVYGRVDDDMIIRRDDQLVRRGADPAIPARVIWTAPGKLGWAHYEAGVITAIVDDTQIIQLDPTGMVLGQWRAPRPITAVRTLARGTAIVHVDGTLMRTTPSGLAPIALNAPVRSLGAYAGIGAGAFLDHGRQVVIDHTGHVVATMQIPPIRTCSDLARAGVEACVTDLGRSLTVVDARTSAVIKMPRPVVLSAPVVRRDGGEVAILTSHPDGQQGLVEYIAPLAAAAPGASPATTAAAIRALAPASRDPLTDALVWRPGTVAQAPPP